MAIHSVNGGGTSALANMVAHQKAASTQAANNDGDADDVSKTAATKASSPTVNLQGQELGKIVNTTA